MQIDTQIRGIEDLTVGILVMVGVINLGTGSHRLVMEGEGEGEVLQGLRLRDREFASIMRVVIARRVLLVIICTHDRGESEFVQEIVKNIVERLKQYQSSDEQYFKGLIGIKENIKEIESLLSIGSKDIRLTGIWGMGGMGKTTLAKVVFKKLSDSQSFEGFCFLNDVREKHKGPGGLDHLRKIIISCLLNDKTIESMVNPVEALPSIIFQRLQRKKVLIVLDDLDSSIQIDDLVKGYLELAPGSRIIVTTRDKHVLTKATNRIHKVKRLNDTDSLDLFRLHAFPENSPTTDDEMVSEVIRYADGNPLVLKVFGGFLCGRDKTVWEGALKKLKRDQDLNIQQVLKISYDGLDNGSKHMFLDIAFLFNSSFTRDHAKSILGDAVEMEITLLIEKCLIEDDEGNTLRMHDLLRQMGLEIVRDEDTEPGNRSRLCDAVEVCDVLENCTGTAAVEVISLDMFEVEKDVIVHPKAFSKMCNLRLLRFYYGDDDTARNEWIHKFKLSIPRALHSYLSPKLWFLQWDSYPLKSLPSKFNPKNLVGLVLRGSRLEKLWKSSKVEKVWNSRKVMSFPVLRSLDLSFSKFCTQPPDLTQVPNLETINLDGCSKFRDVKGLFKRKAGSSKSCIQNFLSNLSLYSSHSHISPKLAPNLRSLILRNTAIETLPPSIGYLSGLVELSLGHCKRLNSLPTSICLLKSLESLNLVGCKKLTTFPEILEPMERLRALWLASSGIEKLPESIENLVSLESLDMGNCKGLEFLPNSLGKLRNLFMMLLSSCSRLQELPAISPSLSMLLMKDCRRLKYLPEIPSQYLCVNAVGCTSLENISNIRCISPFCKTDTPRIFLLDFFTFYGCGKMDQNTRKMLADQALFRILYRLIFGYANSDNGCRKDCFCCPGDEIPEWFDHQTCGTSISNIMPPPNWNDPNFLSVAFCIVVHQNTTDSFPELATKWKFNSQNIEFEHEFRYFSSKGVRHREVSSDHVYIEQVLKPTWQQKMDELNWSNTCCTDVSFHAYLYDRKKSCEIKKFGVRFIYKQDLKSLIEKTERKNKRRFNECCESSGSEAVDSLEEEDDDEAHFKKLKVNAPECL
ncbi:disease resistance protein RUN1-like [Ziziphus jujuba]|uniref:ADP-ribosyl cyclase/cyclic ADP-ribose hydrolase n=1 Tax=Ziziphus jujuba TaxID=326968 RepID=A0ABM4AB62_ZIZJJ|nr:disease resistance protein RUN1-like [Ziziphus jujuba]